MKLYDVMANGQRKDALPEDAVTKLYATGLLNRRSPCRVYGTQEWRNIDECLPLLRYTPQTVAIEVNPPAATDRPATPSHAATLDSDKAGQPARTTALRAGWICVVLGLSVAWLFPPAYCLFFVGFVTAIVAMCTRQVNQGLILLFSSFAAAIVSVLVSLFLAVGFFAKVAAPALVKAREEIAKPTPTATPKPLPAATPAASPSPVQTRAVFPQVRTTVPVHAPVEPTPRPIASLSQREIFEEIARLEKQQRELRAVRQDLAPAKMERLLALRAAQQ